MSSLRAKRDQFEKISKNVSLGFISFSQKINRFTCPCCGYPTLEERNGYDICELCNWEDDGHDDHNSAKTGGPNGSYSLDQARQNFLEYGIMYSPDNDTRITRGDSEERKRLKQDLVSVFETMLISPQATLPTLWQRALDIEKQLDQELEQSVKAYEKSIKHRSTTSE